jgi:hypothetical protein
MNPLILWWGAISVATFLGELVLGTDLGFALCVLAIFLLAPLAILPLARIDNPGATLSAMLLFKLIIPSQWIKIALGQPADSYLPAPNETMLAMLAGTLALVASAHTLRFVIPKPSGRVMAGSDEPDFLWKVAGATVIISLFAVFVRDIVLGVKFQVDDTVEQRGLAIWIHLYGLLPVAIAAMTARRMVLSGGRVSLDAITLAVIAICVITGFWNNTRSSVFWGIVAYFLTYLSYGGRVRASHMALFFGAFLVTQFFIYPLIDIQRGLDRSISPGEYLRETIRIGQSVASGEYQSNDFGARLDATYQSTFSRLYYGDVLNVLDRFSPSQVAEVISFTDTNGQLGLATLFSTVDSLVPRFVLNWFGTDRSVNGGELLEKLIWNTNVPWFLNYGIIAETYAYGGLWCVFGTTFVLTTALYWLIHAVYGGLRRNCWAAYFVTVNLFVLADCDIGVIFSIWSQTIVLHILLYALARFAWGGTRSNTAPVAVRL